MREVTVDEAIKRGKVNLFWVPMILFFLFMFGGLGLGFLHSDFLAPAIITGFGMAFTLPWLWWSWKVADWKIWAFSNVKDGKTLERRAISQQLIWPRGHFFEKTEIKSQLQKQMLEELYRKMDATPSQKEIIEDHSLPEELTVAYPQANFYLYLVLALGSLYLLNEKMYVYGVLGLGFSVYAAIDLNRKIRSKGFVLKLNATGVVLPTRDYSWEAIQSYYIKKDGYGQSTSYALILEGYGIREEIALSEINIGVFKLERYLDVYRSRYEMKQKFSRL